MMRFVITLCLCCWMPAALATASSGPVKVTPLGGQDGEFCRYDRARVFEDPDGTRLLYDAGRTEAFIRASHLPVHVPLSGRSTSFGADGHCMAGC